MCRFAALQQHIDDLTQEKYELMRGMAGQQRVAETLEAENQALTGDFNLQVNSLPADNRQQPTVWNACAVQSVSHRILETLCIYM